MTESYHVVQTEIDSTAAIVYETVELAREKEDYVNVYLEHLEEPHVNLGLIEKPLEGLDEDLQFRRWGGGGTVYHDRTQCFMRAKSKRSPKEELEREKNALAETFLEELDDQFDKTGFYDPEEDLLYRPSTGEIVEADVSDHVAYFDTGAGDIYESMGSKHNSLFDPQIIGIGVADFGDVVVARGCMYPEEPVGISDLREDYTDWVKGVGILDETAYTSMLENDAPVYLDESQFLTQKSQIMGRMLQHREGLRDQYDCF